MTLDEATLSEKRRALASICIFGLSMVSCFTTTATMLIMFVKGGRPRQKFDDQQIKREFLLVFSKVDDLKDLNHQRLELHLEQVEQAKAIRKMKVYREMADRQI